MERADVYPKKNSGTGSVRWAAPALGAVLGVFCLAGNAAAEIKKVAYPEVKVELSKAYKPDAAFESMIGKFIAAAERKDQNALFALVGPNFVWTVAGALSGDFDLGRDAVHNFKVVFGFRAMGANADGGVNDGPYWETLADLAKDRSYYTASDSGKLICGPAGANVTEDEVFTEANDKLANGDDYPTWYFTLGATDVARAPGDRGPPIAKVGTVAMPMLSTFPPGRDGQPTLAPQFLEVLLPSGKSGWISAASAKLLDAEHLCYAKTVSGEWKIVGYDQPED